MNNSRASAAEHYKCLQILDELSGDGSLTQRDLSKRLGIALGMVNSHIRDLMAKGFITVKSTPPRRYLYFLTRRGFAEKTRLSYHLLQDYTRIYREARGNLRILFRELGKDGVRKVVLAGADEAAELAYITLQETDMKLEGVVDGELAGRKFFGRGVRPLEAVRELSYDKVVVASFLRREALYRELVGCGVREKDISVIFSI